MLMKDRETESLWSCYNGVALYGSLEGKNLTRVPAFLCQLGEWLDEHPDSEVLEWTVHPHHEDPRHGHGSWFYFGGRGQHPHALATMLDGELDDRLPESELVLGVCHPSGEVAYPVAEIHRQGRLIHDTLGDEPVVAWGRAPSSPWVGVYSRRLDGETLEFQAAGHGRFCDAGGTVWNTEGKAVEGPVAGRELEPLDFVTVKWNAWAGFYPHTRVYRGPDPPGPHVDAGSFQPLFEAIEEAGFEVAVTDEILTGSLPPGANRGVRMRVAGDPFLAYAFDDAGGAADFGASRLIIPRDRFISFYPGETPSDLPRRALTAGRHVLQSDPDRQYADRPSLERLPEAEIPYSPLLADERLQRAVAGSGGAEVTAGPFTRLFTALDDAGFEVRRVKPMLRQWLRPQAVDGFSAEVGGDRFLIHRFPDAAAAAAYHRERHHTAQAGVFVLRSDPPDQYHVHSEQTYDRPADEVSWSKLLEDPGFVAALEGVE